MIVALHNFNALYKYKIVLEDSITNILVEFTGFFKLKAYVWLVLDIQDKQNFSR